MIIRRRITIISGSRPEPEINTELRWLCESLGLFGPRDKDSSLYRVFIELLRNNKKQSSLTSDSIAYKTNLTRGTVVHHLNKLMESGIIVSDKNKYALRVDNLEHLMDEMQQDAERIFSELKKVAKEIDKELGI